MTTWGQATDEFVVYLRSKELAHTTIAGYGYHLRRFGESAPSGPWTLTASQLGAWIDAQGWSLTTRKSVVQTFRLFYGWAVATGRCEWSPTAGLPTAAPRRPGPAPRPFPAAWAREISEWCTWSMAAGLSPGSLKTRRSWLYRLAESSSDPWSVTTSQLAEWLANPDWAPATRRSARASARAFYTWAVRMGKAVDNPAALLDPVRQPRSLPRPVPDDVLREAIAAADDRTRIALKLAAYAGLRSAEIASLHCTMISEHEILVIGKGGHHRRIPLHPDLASELHAELGRRRRGERGSGFLEGATDTGWLYPSWDRREHITPQYMSKLVGLALPGGWSAHKLRHRFATAVYAHDHDLLTLQQLLGHARPETTARYAAVPDGAKMRAVAAIGL